ncbi:hypothetical protein J2X69_005043 [Algoriphagus sp. 4150]|nr:hypothetical protein [Algoriphagus sp. 4150]
MNKNKDLLTVVEDNIKFTKFSSIILFFMIDFSYINLSKGIS